MSHRVDCKNKKIPVYTKSLLKSFNIVELRGFDPLLLFFMNEIKIVSYSFSSSVIEYNSNEKLLEV